MSSDAESFDRQFAFLLEHSPFYREKLGGETVPLDRIAELPLTT